MFYFCAGSRISLNGTTPSRCQSYILLNFLGNEWNLKNGSCLDNAGVDPALSVEGGGRRSLPRGTLTYDFGEGFRINYMKSGKYWSSRMRIVRCSGRIDGGEGCLPRGSVCQEGVHLGECLPGGGLPEGGVCSEGCLPDTLL